MFILETVLELAALGFLGGFLWRKHLKRMPRKAERISEGPDWNGNAFDPSPLRPRLESVRSDFIAALGSHPGQASRKPRLVSVARHWIGSLTFFRERTPSETRPAAEEQAF